jgi:hypothetical protein
VSGRAALACTVLASAFVAAAGGLETLEWRDAARCAGRACAVTGTVATQEEEEGVMRLYFDRERRDVSVLLVRSLFATWPDYTGRAIVAKGKVRRFREQIEVVVSRRRDIEVAGGATPLVGVEPSFVTSTPESAVATDPSPGETPTPTGDEVERLRRKIEQLERRVRELEGQK